jgi:lipopolysaccharide export system protein LptA
MQMSLVAGLVAALLVSTSVTAADAPLLPPVPQLVAPDTTLPIDLDAAFSEFDRRNNRLIFRALNITQGTLAIKADEATADPADFANSVWVFTGNVRIRNADTRATGDRAELTFRDNQLRKALLTGQPARFSQAGAEGKPPTEGHGQLLEYDVDAATIELRNDAFLSDSRNEISGNRIAYDLRREVVTAGATDGGQVRMRITPQREKPTPAPAPVPTTVPTPVEEP